MRQKTISIVTNHNFIIAVLVLCLLPFIYIAFFAHPVADDHAYASRSMVSGIIENYITDYYTWNGRYASNILMLSNPLAWNLLWLYRIVAVILILLTPFASYIFLKSLTNRQFSSNQLVIFSLMICLLFLGLQPNIAEGIYWYTGSITYHLANLICLVYFALLINLLRGRYIIHKILHFLLCSFLLFIITGFNEIVMAFLFAFHFLLLFFSINRGNYRLPLVFMLISLILTILVITAPGNSIRAGYFPEKYNLMRSLVYGGMQTLRFGSSWVVSGLMLLSTLLFLPFAHKLSGTIAATFPPLLKKPIIWLLILIAVIFLGIFPPYFTTNILGQHRTVNSILFPFIIIWFISVTVWVHYLEQKFQFQIINIPKIISAIVIIILFLGINCTNNGYLAFSDIITGKCQAFSREMDERYEKLKECSANGKDCFIKPLENKPSTLFVLDVSSDPDFLVNLCYKKYFGLTDNNVYLEIKYNLK